MTVKAVDIVRKIRDDHFKETKDMTLQEQIAYYKQKADKLKKNLKTKTADK
jgi:hypothetical protein